MDPLYCTKCGHANPADANFCAQCGEALHPVEDPAATKASDSTRIIPALNDDADGKELSEEERAAINALPESSALLIVRRGPGVGSRYLLDSPESKVGRHPHSDIFLDDITVSREHMTFLRDGHEFSARDLSSLNGTYVNRRLIDADAVLQPGDEVQIGKFRMVFYAGEHGVG